MSHPVFPFGHDVVSRIAARDGSLFTDDPARAEEAAAYMGWTDAATRAETELPQIEALAAGIRAEGLTDVVLLGMGGSSLAALVMGSLLPNDGTRLHVLDTTSPITVRHVLDDTDPATTIHVVASKSGGTVEPNALYAVFRARADAVMGHEAAGRRFVAITDPGSPLERLADDDLMRACVLAPPSVGGRYSALTVFGLVPAALIGVDVHRLVTQARNAQDAIVASGEPPALAHLMAAGHAAGRDKLTLVAPERLQVFGLWVEQLVAESLGKHGTGIVPVVATHDAASRPARSDEVLVVFGGESIDVPEGDAPRLDVPSGDPYDLGAWFVTWEYAVAAVGAALRVNPFDQPNVAEAKAATNAVLDGSLTAPPPDADDAGFSLTFAGRLEAPDRCSLSDAITHALRSLDENDYLAILAFAPDDEERTGMLRAATAALSTLCGRAACFELGPRYLHSTGQLHKGGPNSGVFIVVTTRDEADVEIPGWPFTLGRLHRAQAEGDLVTLAAHGRRVLRVDAPDASRSTLESLAAHFIAAAAAVR